MADLKITHDELEAMLDRSARRGSKAALEAVGLCDEEEKEEEEEETDDER